MRAALLALATLMITSLANAQESRPVLADLPNVITTITSEQASIETITLRQQRCSFFEAGIECSWRTETGMRVFARAADYEQTIDLVMVVPQDIEVSPEMADFITVTVDIMTGYSSTVTAAEMIEKLSQIEIDGDIVLIEAGDVRFSLIHTDILGVALLAEIMD